MDQNVAPFLLGMLFSAILVAAACVVAFWRGVSRSTPKPTRKASLEATPNSPPDSVQAQIAALQTDQASLFSTLEKLTTTVKRLSSRNGMRELREEPAGPPPVGTPKSELRKFYGIDGKTGAEQAALQLTREA